MNKEKDFFKTCFNIVAKLDTKNESETIAKTVILNEIENLQQENEQLKDTIYKAQVLIRRLKITEWGMYGYDLLDLVQNILDGKDISNELLEIEMLKGELK